MYETRIAAEPLLVAAIAGFPPEIDRLAGCNLSGHGFLRAAWYRGNGAQAGRTLVVRRSAAGDDSAVIAAIPTAPFGPAIAGARKVAGSYWPLRGALIAPDCSAIELAQALDHPAARSLGPVWRVGPARGNDPTTQRIIAAAQMAGWTVLSRAAGTSWVIDLDDARTQGWPRASTSKRLRRIERRLATTGRVTWQQVRGHGWDAGVLADLGTIEAESWIAAQTNGSGAKFLTARQRSGWQDMLADPILADKLSATILRMDDRPVAFTFDLDDGPVRYGIAGSYVSDLGGNDIGKLANYRSMADAMADGLSLLDLGAGDSGYKRDMGATEGYVLADLLFVRNRAAARLMAKFWGAAAEPSDRHKPLFAGHDHG